MKVFRWRGLGPPHPIKVFPSGESVSLGSLHPSGVKASGVKASPLGASGGGATPSRPREAPHESVSVRPRGPREGRKCFPREKVFPSGVSPYLLASGQGPSTCTAYGFQGGPYATRFPW